MPGLRQRQPAQVGVGGQVDVPLPARPAGWCGGGEAPCSLHLGVPDTSRSWVGMLAWRPAAGWCVYPRWCASPSPVSVTLMWLGTLICRARGSWQDGVYRCTLACLPRQRLVSRWVGTLACPYLELSWVSTLARLMRMLFWLGS